MTIEDFDAAAYWVQLRLNQILAFLRLPATPLTPATIRHVDTLTRSLLRHTNASTARVMSVHHNILQGVRTGEKSR